MHFLKSRNIQDQLFLFFSYLIIISFFYSRFLISVSLIALFVLSLIKIESEEKIVLKWNQQFRRNLVASVKCTPILLFYLILFITLASYINSSDQLSWLKFVRLKLPYLAVPIIFINQKRLSENQYYNLYFFLIQMCVVSAIFVLGNYILEFERITESIGRGQGIPTPINHTKYSVIIAVSLIAAFILWQKEDYSPFPRSKNLLIVEIIFLLIFIHVLAVRSGLAALYFSVFIMGVLYLISHKQYLRLLLFLIFLTSIPLSAYFLLPSFHNKVHYTLYDLQMNRKGEGDNYNDSMRLRSWKTGWALFKKNPFFGSGIGDLEYENRVLYESAYGFESTPRLPHNQFLFYAAGLGILGFVIFSLSFFTPILYQQNYKNSIFLALMLSLFLLCMVEKPMERSNFIAFYLFFTLASMSRFGNLHDAS